MIVGITPGMNQLELAYAEAQRLLHLGRSQTDILEAVKPLAAFGGEAIRPNLLRMLRHFDFAKMLEISDEADLWGRASELLYSTSVVPNAAFKNGKMFSGRFDEILKVGALPHNSKTVLFPACLSWPMLLFTWRSGRPRMTPSCTASGGDSSRKVSCLGRWRIHQEVEAARLRSISVRRLWLISILRIPCEGA